MGKSLKSKWKKKMRAIKREKMDVKVLARLKNMLVASALEQKLDAKELKIQEQNKPKTAEKEKEVEMAEVTENSQNTETTLSVSENDKMEVEGETTKPKRFWKPNLKTMKNEKNQYPVWMSNKKIKRHIRIQKKVSKRKSKEAKMSKAWKIASSL